MKKRIISLLLAVFMVVGMLPNVGFAAMGDHHTEHTAQCAYVCGEELAENFLSSVAWNTVQLHLVLKAVDVSGNAVNTTFSSYIEQDSIDNREGFTGDFFVGETYTLYDFDLEGYLMQDDEITFTVVSDGISITNGNAYVQQENGTIYIVVPVNAIGGDYVDIDCSTIDLSTSPYYVEGAGWRAEDQSGIPVHELYMTEPYYFTFTNCEYMTTENFHYIFLENGAILNGGVIPDGVWVYVNDGIIQGGTYNGSIDVTKVHVSEYGEICGGTFNARVHNKGVISGGTFNGELSNDGTIINNGDIQLGENFVLDETSCGTVECNAHIWRDGVCRLCGDVCLHSIDSDTGKCTGCTAAMAASAAIGATTTYFQTIQNALNAVQNTTAEDQAKVTLLADMSMSDYLTETLTISGGVFTLDLGENDIYACVDYSPAIHISGGTVTLTGTTGSINGSHVGCGYAMGVTVSGGTLIMEGGELYGYSYGLYVSGGTAEIRDGKVWDGALGAVYVYSGTVRVVGAPVIEAGYHGAFEVYNSGKVDLTGITQGGYTLYAGSSLTVGSNVLLPDGYGMFSGTEEVTTVSDATVTVRCNHSKNESEITDNNDGTHSFTCSVCETAVTEEDHTADETVGQTCKGYQCRVCGVWYGEADENNHMGPYTAVFEWNEPYEQECYVEVYLYCGSCNAENAAGDGWGYGTLSETAEPADCKTPGYERYTVTIEIDGVEYTDTEEFAVYSDDHPGYDTDGFCTACGGYQAAYYNEADDVYEISNAGQLYWYAQYLNNENAEIHAELTRDIIIPEDAPNWVPINASYAYFNGNFHSISGLKCVGGENDTYVGFFGNEIWWYEISNLHITGSYFEGAAYVGAVAACMTNGGSITNCYVTNTTVKGDGDDVGGLVGYLGGSQVVNCYSAATVIGEGANMLVGDQSAYFDNTIKNSYYLSETETEDGGKTAAQFASGEVAYLLQSGVPEEDVYDEEGNWTGTRIPEIWGQTIGTDTYPVFSDAKVHYGYISCAGDALAVYTNDSSAAVEKPGHTEDYTDNGDGTHDGVCTACGDVLADDETHTPDEDSYTDNGNGTHSFTCTVCGTATEKHSYTDGTCTGCGAVCGHESYANGACTACGAVCSHEGYENGFCTVCDGYQAAELNEDGCYEIANAGQLYWFAAVVNGGYGDVAQNGAAKAVLTDNIVVNANVLTANGTLNGDGSGLRAWTPIGNFNNQYSGAFDGGNYTVSGLYFKSSTNYVGLFGIVGNGGSVQNVGVIDSYFSGIYYVGGVVGQNNGTVTNCHNTGTVGGGNNYAGGVVGYNTGTVSNSRNTGTINVTGKNVGGVAGYSNDTVTGCYNSGTVSGSSYVGGVVGCNVSGTVTNCYGTGTVSYIPGIIGSYIGGVVGWNGAVIGAGIGSATNCYYLTGTASGGINGSDAEGQAEAKTAAQFAGGEVAYLLSQGCTVGDETYSGDVWGQNLDTDAYPNFTGDPVYQITNCKNETRYSNTNADLDHSWSSGTCTVCGETISITASMAPEKDLSMTFTVSNLEGEGNCAVITHTKADGTVLTTTINQADWENNTFTYYGVAAKELADTITVTVYNSGNEVVSLVYTGTARDVLMAQLAATTDAKLQTLLVDTLNYGAAAQVYFKYNTGDLANKDLTAEQQALATQTVSAGDDRVKGTGYAGSTLALGNTIKLNFVFNNSAIKNAAKAVFTYTPVGSSEEKTITITSAEFTKYSSTRTRMTVEIPVLDAGELVKCSIQDASGNEITFASDSVESYIARSTASNVLYEALLKYVTSAKAYLGK